MNLQIGLPLLTKDGRKIGNAIVIDFRDVGVDIKHYLIETDFGHRTFLTEKEIDGLFYSGEDRLCDYEGTPIISGQENLSQWIHSHKELVESNEY